MAWHSTREMRDEAEGVFIKLSNHEIDVDIARTLGAQIRTATKLIAIELDAARVRGTLKKGGKLPSVSLS